MDRSAGRALRWLRALLLAVVSVAGGAIGHITADGLLPGWGALGALVLIAAAGAAPLLGRPASTLRVVSLLMVGQTLIHVVLTAMAGHKDAPVGNAAAAAPRLSAPDLANGGRPVGSWYDQFHNDAPVLEHLTIPGPVQHVLADLTGANALMALVHLAAAGAVGLWLAVGERTLWTVLALTSDSVEALARAVIGANLQAIQALSRFACTNGPGLVPPDTVRVNRRPPKLLLLSRAVVRRGPPRLLAA